MFLSRPSLLIFCLVIAACGDDSLSNVYDPSYGPTGSADGIYEDDVYDDEAELEGERERVARARLVVAVVRVDAHHAHERRLRLAVAPAAADGHVGVAGRALAAEGADGADDATPHCVLVQEHPVGSRHRLHLRHLVLPHLPTRGEG